MKPVNNKIYFKILPDETNEGLVKYMPTNGLGLKKVEVLEVGNSVVEVKKGDIISLYANDIMLITSETGFCTELNVVLINSNPKKGKVRVTKPEKMLGQKLSKAKVISTGDDEITLNSKVGFREGQSLALIDGSEIISNTQIFYVED